ncbi:MAG TPA: lipopolysaccharide biosynthesis protein [Vicinamibacterales bacterium]|nr:lipopolysaccharide biosynthesis protein [Vicinamibacterales bacterium]
MSTEHQDPYFRTDHLKVGLGARTARGGAVTLFSQGLKFVLAIVVAATLARLLTPGDYGLIGMVAVFTGFASLFKDLGLSTATIQREEISVGQVSTLFWINVTVSVLLAIVFAASAPAIAWFYSEPRLIPIGVATSLGFVLGGLAVQHESLLRRQMRFMVLAVIEITSILIGAGVAIFWAWYGLGYWALVLSQLSAALATAMGVWAACRWRPGLPVRNSGIRVMLKFGGHFTGFQIANFFARNLDNLLIGRFWGPQQLGFYSRAYQLLLLPIEQVNAPIAAVAVPALSRMVGTPERYRDAYLRMVEKVAMLTMPSMAFMILTADWIVRIVLGPQWSEVGRIFAWLGLVGLVQPIANTAGWLFITQGRTHHMFQLSLIGTPFTILAFVVGLRWGAVGVAASYSVVVVCTIPLVFWYACRTGPVRAIDIYRTIAPSLCAALCALAVGFLFRRWSGIAAPLTGLAGAFLILTATTFAVLVSLPAGRRSLRDLKPLAMLLTQKPTTA